MRRRAGFDGRPRRTATVLAVLALIATLGSGEQRALPAEEVPVVSNHGYMQTSGADGEAIVLPLRHTEVEADIVGVMSSVKVTQHFANATGKPIEAVYVFPLPHRAAVHAMTMRIGDRVITARIDRRAQARAAYQRARKQGKTAALLEQERPNIFTQSVANIMPGDQIRVELSYVEELVPEDGLYSFVFPMVVGPRYMGEGAPLPRSTGTGWAPDTARVKDASRISPKLLPPGTRSGHDISLTLRIHAGVALHGLESPSHKTTLEQQTNDAAVISLDQGDRIPNRDFVARYQLAGQVPQVVALAARDPQLGGHFLLMVQPSARPAPSELASKEYVFVVDSSGSMDGQPIEQVKLIAQRCLGALRPDDRFQVIQFANGASALAPQPLAPSPENLERALTFIAAMHGGGGTEFLPALELALQAPRDPRRARIVVFMSDGYIGYEAEVLRFIRQHLGGTNLFAVGVGSSVNRYLIDGMARIGGGEPFILLNREGEGPLIQRLFTTISRPALTSVQVSWGKLPVERVTPARVPDLFADRPIVVAGRFGGAGGEDEVTLRGFLGGKPYEQKIRLALPSTSSPSGGPSLAYLWARRRIDELMDRYATEPELGPAIQREVTELGLRYSLMSKWTSFVAIDQQVRNRGGKSDQVPVPVPLPEDVSTKAAPPSAFISAPSSAQGSLSTDQFTPGDPEVQIRAPENTAKVTLLFPSGELKACARDPLSGLWRTSFLIPESTPDGIYTIRVLITLADGEQLMRTLRYQVDGATPRVRVRLVPERTAPGQLVTVVAEPESLAPVESAAPAAEDIGDPSFAGRVLQEIKSVQVRWPGATQELSLAAQPDGSWRHSFAAPTTRGRYPVIVVVRDPAGNKLRQELWLEIQE